jgi:hypothetical protein
MSIGKSYSHVKPPNPPALPAVFEKPPKRFWAPKSFPKQPAFLAYWHLSRSLIASHSISLTPHMIMDCGERQPEVCEVAAHKAVSGVLRDGQLVCNEKSRMFLLRSGCNFS